MIPVGAEYTLSAFGRQLLFAAVPAAIDLRHLIFQGFIVDDAQHPKQEAGQEELYEHRSNRTRPATLFLFAGNNGEVTRVPFANLPPLSSTRSDVRRSHDVRLWLAVNKLGLFELRDGTGRLAAVVPSR